MKQGGFYIGEEENDLNEYMQSETQFLFDEDDVIGKNLQIMASYGNQKGGVAEYSYSTEEMIDGGYGSEDIDEESAIVEAIKAENESQLRQKYPIKMAAKDIAGAVWEGLLAFGMVKDSEYGNKSERNFIIGLVAREISGDNHRYWKNGEHAVYRLCSTMFNPRFLKKEQISGSEKTRTVPVKPLLDEEKLRLTYTLLENLDLRQLYSFRDAGGDLTLMIEFMQKKNMIPRGGLQIIIDEVNGGIAQVNFKIHSSQLDSFMARFNEFEKDNLYIPEITRKDSGGGMSEISVIAHKSSLRYITSAAYYLNGFSERRRGEVIANLESKGLVVEKNKITRNWVEDIPFCTLPHLRYNEIRLLNETSITLSQIIQSRSSSDYFYSFESEQQRNAIKETLLQKGVAVLPSYKTDPELCAEEARILHTTGKNISDILNARGGSYICYDAAKELVKTQWQKLREIAPPNYSSDKVVQRMRVDLGTAYMDFSTKTPIRRTASGTILSSKDVTFSSSPISDAVSYMFEEKTPPVTPRLISDSQEQVSSSLESTSASVAMGLNDKEPKYNTIM